MTSLKKYVYAIFSVVHSKTLKTYHLLDELDAEEIVCLL